MMKVDGVFDKDEWNIYCNVYIYIWDARESCVISKKIHRLAEVLGL